MQILFINNDGGGFADRIEVAADTTVSQLFSQRVPHGRPQDYLIRVNRQPTTADAILQPDDRVSCTPTKIEGALPTGTRYRVWSDPHFNLKGSRWEPDNGSTASICSAW